MDIHWFDEGDAWFVVAGADVTRVATRSGAFAHARSLAQRHAPSRLVREAPPGWPDVPGAPAATPPAAAPPDRPIEEDPWFDDVASSIDDDSAADLDLGGPPEPRRSTTPSRRTPPPHSAAPTQSAPSASDTAIARRSPSHDAPPAKPSPILRDGPVDWARLAGPLALGRSIVVAPGAPAPEPWANAERITVGTDGATDLTTELAADGVLERIRAAFLTRTPVVYELDPDATEPVEARTTVDVWRLRPDVELDAEAAWHLLWANAIDARRPDQPNWIWADHAVAAGATVPESAATPATDVPGDVVLLDGRAAWCDGGPLRFWTAAELGDDTPVIPHVTLERSRLDPTTDQPPTAELAPDQLASVGESGATSRIVAPAGSGKTRVLTERARYLVATQHLPPAALCLVAFNKRAQLEMQERTSELRGLQVQTLNALALAVLNGGRGFADRNERVRTIDELAVRNILSDLVQFPRRANTDPAAAWLDALSAVRLGLRNPTDVEAEFNGDVDGFADVFGTYRRTLASRGVVDFDDQIYRAIEVLLAEPDTRRQARHACRLLMVDEFQDLTPAHLLLIRLLAGPELAVFGVGDDDQTIYGYSGASPDWLIDYDRWFPGATHHALEVNYRCPAPVVTAASNLLSYNQRRVAKTITPGPNNVTDPDALAIEQAAEPVDATMARIDALLADGIAPADIAVLARVNALLAPIQVALHERGIPTANSEGARFVERTGVAAALSWLKLATAGGGFTDADIQRAARRPGRGLSPKLIEWMGEQRDVDGLRRLAARLNTERDVDKVEAFAQDLETLTRRAGHTRTAPLIEAIRAEIGLDKAMSTLDSAHRGRNATAHADDLRALIALGRLHPDPVTFATWLRRALDTPPDPDGVQLATVHKVKGLEWPHVIVHDATQSLFPHHLSTDIEEERRVFHVAVTRGQTSVLVVADEARPSMFLAELATKAAPRPAPSEAPAQTGRGVSGTASPSANDLPATVGLELSWGGYDGEIAEIGDTDVVLAVGRARFPVPFGSTVTVNGRWRTLAPPAPAGRTSRKAKGGDQPTVDDADVDLLAALKAWRAERAKTDGVPAYVVAPDKTLVEIASTRPASDADLLGVSGIGPAKLERYGDEILALVESSSVPGPPSDGGD